MSSIRMGRYEGKMRGGVRGWGEGVGGGVEGKNGLPPGQNTAARVREKGKYPQAQVNAL
jgi:hypothetical protein